MNYVGLDISKAKIDVCILKDNEIKYFKINNNLNDIDKLIIDLKEIKNIHCCCEYTNIYHQLIATKLFQANLKISVVNPKQIKFYAQTCGIKNKSDKTDAKLIADFCQKMKPDLWSPTDKEIIQILALVKRIDALTISKTREKNRKQVSDVVIQKSIQKQIEFYEAEIEDLENQLNTLINKNEKFSQIKNLLISIPSIGEKTANVLVAVFSQIDKFSSAKRLVSYFGLSPTSGQSGKTVLWNGGISKAGNGFFRKSLYMSARVACLRCKIFMSWSRKRFERGKHAKSVYVAMMSKLLTICYSVIKQNQAFDKNRLNFA